MSLAADAVMVPPSNAAAEIIAAAETVASAAMDIFLFLVIFGSENDCSLCMLRRKTVRENCMQLPPFCGLPVKFTIKKSICQTLLFAPGKYFSIFHKTLTRMRVRAPVQPPIFISNSFHGASERGGSAMNRSFSPVTGWGKASEYAHSASLPFTERSPP